jgi:hypothetical protein
MAAGPFWPVHNPGLLRLRTRLELGLSEAPAGGFLLIRRFKAPRFMRWDTTAQKWGTLSTFSVKIQSDDFICSDTSPRQATGSSRAAVNPVFDRE